MKKQKKKLPLTHALAWIVGSALAINGGSFAAFKHYQQKKALDARNPEFAIRTMVQTGPQKEALKTEYLAELIGISADNPPSAQFFNLEKAKARLLKSPLISRAEVKLLKPATLYVDYTVRQPVAWLEDYANVALDKEGYPFPFTPFFTPKNLPSLYLGLSPFGMPPSDPDRPTAQWGAPMTGKYIRLALDILAIATDPKVADYFSIKRIDVSNAFAESYGTREIVVITEDLIPGKDSQCVQPRILRLSTKNFAQELGNYLRLRPQLLEEERKTAASPRLKEKIIDFRIQKLAFIEEHKKGH